ncbi:hypothetical protein [Candidatus Electronema sp. PJ]|uniref:hypothetical protein n=1 Tax=Candidatus Electronema sp. PJ TaxID=3401572 RepID=UPI003AA82D41
MVLDLYPYLTAPSSVTKLANTLKSQVINSDSQATIEVLEYPDRLILKQSLKYKGNAKACSERGDELSKQGIPCYKKKMDVTMLILREK